MPSHSPTFLTSRAGTKQAQPESVDVSYLSSAAPTSRYFPIRHKSTPLPPPAPSDNKHILTSHVLPSTTRPSSAFPPYLTCQAISDRTRRSSSFHHHTDWPSPFQPCLTVSQTNIRRTDPALVAHTHTHLTNQARPSPAIFRPISSYQYTSILTIRTRSYRITTTSRPCSVRLEATNQIMVVL